jgi:hypothetical protein
MGVNEIHMVNDHKYLVCEVADQRGYISMWWGSVVTCGPYAYVTLHAH